MKQSAPRWIFFLLAAFLSGSGCWLGSALRQITPGQPSPSPTLTDQSLEGEALQPETPTLLASPSPSPALEVTSALSIPLEQPVIQIPLAGPAAVPEVEFSGMAWYGDDLFLLPQYPERFPDRSQPGILFTLSRSVLLAFLDGESQDPLVPAEVPLFGPDLKALIPGYEGFEAIAFIEDRVYLTIESGELGPMMSYLVAGRIDPEIPEIRFDTNPLLSIPPQSDLLNRGEEALVVEGDHLLSLYETNGAGIVFDPVAHRIDPETLAVDTIPLPNVEYRITGATPVDPSGRFWALNTFFPGDFFIFPEADPIASRYGQGVTHSGELAVERLLQMQVGPDEITLVERPPIQFELLDSFQGRNWEGLAELPGRGFLLVTDRHPETILAFVPYP